MTEADRENGVRSLSEREQSRSQGTLTEENAAILNGLPWRTFERFDRSNIWIRPGGLSTFTGQVPSQEISWILKTAVLSSVMLLLLVVIFLLYAGWSMATLDLSTYLSIVSVVANCVTALFTTLGYFKLNTAWKHSHASQASSTHDPPASAIGTISLSPDDRQLIRDIITDTIAVRTETRAVLVTIERLTAQNAEGTATLANLLREQASAQFGS